MKFLIIRHGDPDYAHDSLTEKGFREAELLSEKLKNQKIDYFYCSPLGRARRTAEPTLQKTGKTAEILEWAQEMPCGIDVDYSSIGIDFKGHISPWDMCPPYWTVQDEMYDPKKWQDATVFRNTNIPERVKIVSEGFEDLMKKHGLQKEGRYYRFMPGCQKDAVIALFCHMGFGNCLISQITGAALPVIWHNFFLPTTSVTTVQFEVFDCCPDVCIPRITCLGDVSHLAAGNEPTSSSGLHSKLE